jgi:uncharacterized protein
MADLVLVRRKNMISSCRLTKRFAVGGLLLLGALNFARGEELPAAPKSYFNDYAGVTSETTRHDLNERLAKFDKDTANQVVVAIFAKMDSTLSLDEYTLRVAKAWGVGQRGKNNGVVLFVFIHDRTMRIQVGYGLTRLLTDALSKQILDRDLKPRFEKGDFDGGFTAGVESMLKIIDSQTQSGRAGSQVSASSNHAMQPTPGRRTVKFSMIRTSPPAATRAPASGG